MADGSATSRRSTIRSGLSSTAKRDPLHGFECEAMTLAQIKETVQAFAEGARRAREAGLDGVELHGANGYLITQFLSSAINDRTDEYGGVLANRARFVREIVQAIRARVGRDFHLQMKISATEFNNALLPEEKPGNTVEDSIQVCQWLKDDGVDAIHVSSGSSFPHPKNPAGDLPIDELQKDLRQPDLERRAGAAQLPPVHRQAHRRAVQAAVGRRRAVRRTRSKGSTSRMPARSSRRWATIPVLCTGGFQTAADHRGRDRARRLRRGDHRAAAHREQRPGAAVRQRDRPSGQSVHVLQPVSGERSGESARLLRREPVPVARGDDRRRFSASTSPQTFQ